MAMVTKVEKKEQMIYGLVVIIKPKNYITMDNQQRSLLIIFNYIITDVFIDYPDMGVGFCIIRNGESYLFTILSLYKDRIKIND